MRILQVISSEGLYGAENMLLTLSRDLSEAGLDCRVAVFCDGRDPHIEVADAAMAMGLETDILPCRGRFDRSTVLGLRRLIEEHRIGVVHSHGYKSNLFAAAASALLPVVRISTCHNWPDRRLLMQTYAALDRLILRGFDHATTPSQTVADILVRSGVKSDRVSWLANGVDIVRFAPASPVRNRKGRLVVGFVGRLVHEKGGAVLLESAAEVLRDFPETDFVFVGDGPMKSEWEAIARRKGIADNVIFQGVRLDMPAVYSCFDLLVLPSFNEAMPMTVLEAMASGLPVIATNVGSVPGVVTPHVTGLLVPQRDSAELTTALKHMLADEALRQRYGAAARHDVVARFSSQALARRYASVYQTAWNARQIRLGRRVDSGMTA